MSDVGGLLFRNHSYMSIVVQQPDDIRNSKFISL